MDPIEEIHLLSSRLVELLKTVPKASELREKENRIKRLIKSDPRVCFSTLICRIAPIRDAYQILLVIQVYHQVLVSSKGNIALFRDDSSRVIAELDEISVAFPNCKPICSRLIALIIGKSIRPTSILTYLSALSAPDDKFRITVLSELPWFDSVEDPDMDRWAKEIVPMLVHHQLWESLEKWMPYIHGPDLLATGLFDTLLSSNDMVSQLEEMLMVSCKKQEVFPAIMRLVENCFRSKAEEHILCGLHLLSGVTPLVMASNDARVFSAVIQWLKAVDVRTNLEMRESVMSVLEGLLVLNVDTMQLLLQLSTYPKDIEKQYPCHNRLDKANRESMNTDDPNEDIKQRMMELRGDCRQVFRLSCVQERDKVFAVLSDLFRKISPVAQWREFESLMHAFSALHVKFEELGPLVASDLFVRIKVDGSVHRAVLSSVVVCLTNSPVKPAEQELRFTLSCLSRIDTIDHEFGWFDFRTKQDNAAVVLLQSVAGSRTPGVGLKLVEMLPEYATGIKHILYHRDGFFQSRVIFIRSVVRAMLSDKVDVETLVGIMRIFCETVNDLAVVILDLPSGHQQALLPLVAAGTSNFTAVQEPGFEVIVSVYADRIPTETIFRILSQVDTVGEWIPYVPALARVHGINCVFLIASRIDQTSMKILPRSWFVECMPLITDQEFHKQWAHSLYLWLTPDTPNDVASAASEYIAKVAVNFVSNPLWANVILECIAVLVKMAIRCSTALHGLADVIVLTGQKPLESIMGPSPETLSLYNACVAKDYGKIKRILKKSS